MDAKKKRRRYGGGPAGAIRHPPGRLGWLGDGMQLTTTTFATTTTGNDDDDDGNNMNGDDGHRHDADGEAICALAAPAKRAGINSDDYDVATTTNTIDLTDENDVEDLREINHRTESERGGEQEIEIATMEHDDNNDNAAKTNGWVCRACTLINPEHISSCEACNTAKRVAGGGGSLPNRRHRNQQFRSTSSFKSTRILSSTATTTIGTKRLVAEEVQPNDINCSTMWIDKYAPRTSQEL